MAKKKKIKTLKGVRLAIIGLNWSAKDGSCFIYRVNPIGQHDMKRHPKFKQFSIISNTEWPVGYVVDVDLSVFMKNGIEDYHVERVIYKWPDSPPEQWAFLNRIANNKNYRRLLYRFEEKYTPGTFILDVITEEKNESSVIQTLGFKQPDDNKEINRFMNFRSDLLKYKESSAFLAILPEEVRELLTDSEAEKISKLTENDPKASAKRFLEQPLEALKVEGIGFKTIDKIREKMYKLDPDNWNYNPNNPMRVYYGSYSVISEYFTNKGDTYMTLDVFKKELIENLKIDKKVVESFIEIDRFNINNKVMASSQIHIEDGLVSTYTLWNSESTIYKFLRSDHKLDEIRGFDRFLSEFKEEQELTVTDEQLSAFEALKDNKITLLIGPGGTGKTWLVSKLVDFFKYMNKKTILTSPTGKAAQVLSRYSNDTAHTIHKTFAISPSFKEGVRVYGDLLVIDEFSMVDAELFATVVKLIDNDPRLRLLIVGDEYQLPSVGPGNLLHTFINKEMVKVIRLTKVFRTNNVDGGITQLSENLRKGRFPFKNGDAAYAVSNDLVIQNLPDKEDLLRRTLFAYKHMLNDGITPENIMVLTPKNKDLTGQVNMNIHLQRIIREHYQKDPDEFYVSKNSYGIETKFYLGDFVMFTKNQEFYSIFDPDADLSEMNLDDEKTINVNNGDVGLIIDISPQALIINVIGESDPIYVEVGSIEELSLAYAYTIHKSQGSQSDYGIMAISSGDTFMLNANLIYTGVSRFKERLYFFGAMNAVRFKSRTFINQNRNTLLEHFINNEDIVF